MPIFNNISYSVAWFLVEEIPVVSVLGYLWLKV